MTKPKFRFEKPIIKSKTEPASKNVLWYFSQQKKGLTINTIKEYIKSQGWVDLFDTAPMELEEATFTSNGQYTNSNGGWNVVTVQVPSNGSENEYIIPYTTNDGELINIKTSDFGANVTNNTYDRGFGIIVFDRPIIKIGNDAFQANTSLTSIIIPNSVTSIGNEAFSSCTSLTSVILPDSVTSIGDYAFQGCTSLISPVYNAHCFAYMPSSFEGVYTIPDGIKQIASTAFYYCLHLTSVTIPNSVTSIEEEAFEACSSLTSISIPNSVTKIESRVFWGCKALTSMSIPDSVTRIGSYVFYGCSGLISVTIGKSVTRIGQSAFQGCSSLTSVTCKATTPPTLDSYDIMQLPSLKVIYVPAESVDIYKEATNWSYYSSIIQPIPES